MRMDVMPGTGRTTLRRLAVLGAVFALEAGTAAAQSGAAITIDSLTLHAPAIAEGGRATATLTFTVTAGARDVSADDDVTVRFAFDVANIADSPEGKAADGTDFWGLTGNLDDTRKTVKVAAVAAGAAAQYTVTHEFGLRPDDDAEDEKFRLAATVAGWAAAGRRAATTDAVFIISDDEEQRYWLSLSGAHRTIAEDAAEATPVSLHLRPSRTRHGTVPDFTVVVEPDLSVYDFDPALPEEAFAYVDELSVPAGTIRASADQNREDETVTLKLYADAAAGAPTHELAIGVIDKDKLPSADAITAVAKDQAKGGKEVGSVIEGGDPVYLTVTVDRGRDPAAVTPESLQIDLRPADPAQAADYDLAPSRVTLPAVTAVDGKQSTTAEIELSARRDQDVGDETLVLNLEVTGRGDNGPGKSVGTFSIAIGDTTLKQVAPKPDDVVDAAFAAAVAQGAGDGELNPGESFTVDVADLFTVTEGYRVDYSASSSSAAVGISISDGTVTFEALQKGGATVTVTATAAPAAASAAVPQTVANVAEVAYDVTVSLIDLVVTLSGPDDLNLTEGGWATLTATANRPVAARTVFELIQTAGTASPTDYEIIEPIAIPAGGTTGATRMRAFEDDEAEAGETLTLEGRSGASLKTNPLTFHLWDAAAPALPAAALLALAALLAAGGRRRLRRR